MYIRKTEDWWYIQVNYGYGDGWEDEVGEKTLREAKRRKREYLENCDFPVRIKLKREPKYPIG